MTSFLSLKKYLIFILPLLFLVAGINFNRAKYINDPDYIYIVNALAICNGKSVGHVDNPGTTVMEIGAATIAIIHLFSNPENETLINHVLSDPDWFLEGIRLVFIILDALILFFLGFTALKKLKSIWFALLLQISCFISVNTLDHVWTKVSPEPILFFITGIFVITLLYYYSEKEKNSWKYVIIFSLISGFGLATKATYLPLTLFPLIVLPSIKKKLYYLAGIIPSFVLFTIPAVPEYEAMYYWFRNLIGHSGIYGQGESNFINLNSYLPDIIEILSNNPFLTIAISAGIVTVILKVLIGKNYKSQQNLKFLIGLIFTQIFGILLVAKHYSANHYLIPVLLLSGITFLFILEIISDSILNQKLNRFFAPVTVIILGTILLIMQPNELYQTSKNYGISTQEFDTTDLMLKNNYNDFTLINYYDFSMNKFNALKFGDIYAKGRIKPYLKKRYPNTYFYDFDNNQFLNWGAEIQLSSIIDWTSNKILLINGPADETKIKEMASRGFPLTQIYKGKVQNIYMLDTVQYNARYGNVIKEETIIDSFGAEHLSADNSVYLSQNLKKIGSIESRTDEQSRTGNYAIKLDKDVTYAIEYQLDSLIKGDIYEIDVWRKTIESPAYMVISSKQQDIFYLALNESIKTEPDGWELIRAKFTVSEKMEQQFLYIYFWNPFKKQVYFDDFLIKKINIHSSYPN